MTDQKKPLANRIALVTGASRGIGYAIAAALAKNGAHVVATGRTVGGLEELDDEIGAAGGTMTGVPFNLTDTPAIERLTAAINERYQRLDIMVLNAGLGGTSSPLDHIQPKDWDEMLAVNVTANWQVLRHMHALLLRSDAGRVVVMSGNAAIRPRAYRGSYAVTKGALDAMARVYADETASTPIRVTLVNPGPTRTKMRAAIAPGEDPMTLPTPAEVASTIVPLCLPTFNDSGKMWDFRAGKLKSFRLPE